MYMGQSNFYFLFEIDWTQTKHKMGIIDKLKYLISSHTGG